MSIKVQNLQKVYPNGYPAVGGTSFAIGKNEVVGLLGPNGAGKTSTFSVLTMELAKSQGDVSLMNIPVESFDTMT
jgi:ABC-type multidrug transport system ATPase subunit